MDRLKSFVLDIRILFFRKFQNKHFFLQSQQALNFKLLHLNNQN